jgi:chorismate synthase
MAGNSFGTLFRFTTWGESHGPAIGVVVDGTPPRLVLNEALIQPWLDLRRPGQSRFVTQRREADKVRLLSGVYEGKTTGTPIAMIIDNQDQRSRDYDNIITKFRPGHGDYTYWKKYGIRDPRGGGRSSARETACRVAAGAIARLVLAAALPGFILRGALIQLGRFPIDRSRWDWKEVECNPFFCPDPQTVDCWKQHLEQLRRAGSSTGAVVEIVAQGVPAGLGDPVYDKLDADLARAMLSINAVKGVEIGDGFSAVGLSGEESVDEMQISSNKEVCFLSNHAGGILGGISTGQDIIVRLAIKPTSSILIPLRTVDCSGNETQISTKGRHDPCVGIRAVPVGEAMMACVLADHWLRYKAQCK